MLFYYKPHPFWGLGYRTLLFLKSPHIGKKSNSFYLYEHFLNDFKPQRETRGFNLMQKKKASKLNLLLVNCYFEDAKLKDMPFHTLPFLLCFTFSLYKHFPQ